MKDRETALGAQNTYTPAIRFKEFGGDWKEKEIGNVLMEVKRPIELKDSTLYQLVTVKRRNQGVVPRGLLKGVDILVKTYFVVRAGDYLISKRQVVHGANGIVPKSLDNAVVSNEYLVVTDNEYITTKFWTAISKRNEMHKIFFISSYGVDIEKLVFDVSDWKKRVVTIPKLTEQRRITDYLQQLDTLIAQHQQKYDKLLNVKKSLLEKMFPKQGTDEPEIRFNGFSGEWEEKALGRCFDERVERSAEGELISITINSGIKRFKDLGRHNNSSEDKSNYKRVEVGDIAYNSMRMWQGSSGYSPYKGILSPAYTVIVPKENANSLFFSYLIKKPEMIHIFQKRSQGITSDTWNLKFPAFSEIEVTHPNQEEQTKIGDLFKLLDTLINQHQTQLKKLGNIKQACLEKMFT
jgi:type I restriction enzyme, S subunit